MVTPLRSMRIPDEIWEPALVNTAAREETVTDVVLRALLEYNRKSVV